MCVGEYGCIGVLLCGVRVSGCVVMGGSMGEWGV